jgi:hypothetical protein
MACRMGGSRWRCRTLRGGEGNFEGLRRDVETCLTKGSV